MPEAALKKINNIENLVNSISDFNGRAEPEEFAPIKVWSFICTNTKGNLDLNRDILIEYFGNPIVYGKEKFPEHMKRAMAILKRYSTFASRGEEVFGKVNGANSIVELVVISPIDAGAYPVDSVLDSVIYHIARIEVHYDERAKGALKT